MLKRETWWVNNYMPIPLAEEPGDEPPPEFGTTREGESNGKEIWNKGWTRPQMVCSPTSMAEQKLDEKTEPGQ